MNQKVTTTLFTCLALFMMVSQSQAQVSVTDDITSDVTWTANNTYMLDGLIFVDDGATLTIEPGTVIKGLEQGSITTGDGASALIVRRGGKIYAEGTASNPIIFTSELDDVADATDLDQRDRGLWGGVIILGKATTNMPTTDNQIEGIDILTDPALYGGTDDHDNSGTLRYVSIRHGGFSISGVEGDEINGLTMGAVGDGTTIEYVEVFANFDDCYEWFGGTVNAKYLVGAFCGDDSYDYDQGFRGKGQFWFSIHDTDVAGRGGEHDGGDGVEDATPFSIPVISNVTYIGSGQNVNPLPGGDENGDVLKVRDNAGGKYWNSIFTEFPKESVDVEDLSSGEDSRARLEAGDLALNNNWFWNVGSSNDFSSTGDAWSQAIIEASNSYSDPDLAGICRTMDNCLDPRPNAGSAAMSAAVSVGDSFFDDVSYVGAFGENLWVSDWTALAANGFLGRISSVALEELEGTLPTTIELDQNYPNPFNPSTAIEYRVAASFNVRLAVYDILGREVAELVNDVQPAGSYRVTFDATGLTSGMYIYRLEVGGDVITKSMMLMK